MTTRNQTITFLMFWGAALIIELFVAQSLGFDIFRNLRASIYACGAIALLPAGLFHFGFMKVRNQYGRWQLRRGKDPNQDQNYEDDDGVLHITEIPDSQKQRDLSLGELVSGLEQVNDDWNENSTSSR